MNEAVPLVKRSIAEVIGMLSKILIPNQEWPELLQFIFQSTQSEELKDKEQAMMMLSVIIEYFTIDLIKQYYDQLNPIIENYLRSDVPSLKELSIVTVHKLADSPQSVQVMKKYHTLIPLVLGALDGLQSEDVILKVFETFTEFAEFKRVLGPSLTGIIEKALSLASDSDYGANLRSQCMFFIEHVSGVYAKPLIKKHGIGFVDGIVATGFKIASEDPEMYKGMDDSPIDYAVDMVLGWAFHVPNEKIWPILTKYLQQFGTSAAEYERAAATYVLCAVTDNDACLVNVRDDIDAMTNFLTQVMSDQSFAVREAAGVCMGRFAEVIGDDFLDKHKMLMPFLVKLVRDMLGSKEEDAIVATLQGMNEFVQNLDYDIKYYLKDTVELLVQYVTNTGFGREVVYWALMTLSSTILVAEKKILPFKETLVQLLSQIIVAQDGTVKLQNIKGQSLLCAGRLISACGPEQLAGETLDGFSKFAMDCLTQQTDSKTELRENALNYFGDLAELLKEGVAPVVNPVLDQLMHTLEADNDFKKVVRDKKDAGFSLGSDSEDGDEPDMELDISVLDEKVAAILCVGKFCMHAPTACQPRMNQILEALEKK